MSIPTETPDGFSIRQRTVTLGELVDYINEQAAAHRDKRVASEHHVVQQYHMGAQDALGQLALWLVIHT